MSHNHSTLMKYCIAMTIPVMIATTCVHVGFEHTHENGHEHHAHLHSHPHNHDHSQKHHHHKHHHHKHAHDEKEDVSQTHIHITVFGFELTLPGLSRELNNQDSNRTKTNAKVASHQPTTRVSASACNDERIVELRPEISIPGLFQILILVESNIAERTRIPQFCECEFMTPASELLRGRCRDLPLTPPPV